MRILFDQGAPVPLRRSLTQHEAVTAYERGWSKLTNGELLDVTEEDGFEALVLTDLNLKYQQNLQTRRIAIIALSPPSWPCIQHAIPRVVQEVSASSPGSYVEVAIP